MLDLATVHGRFQPPHLDHLEYILAAVAETRHLLIGITQSDPTQLIDCPEDPHRAEVAANPLSYEERCSAIRAMLVANGVAQQRFSFVRFPIDMPDKLREQVNVGIVCFTTVRDLWNIVKVGRLRELGYEVRILWDRTGEVGRNGTEIRHKIYSGDDSWEKDMHPAVVEYMKSELIVERIRSLCGPNSRVSGADSGD